MQKEHSCPGVRDERSEKGRKASSSNRALAPDHGRVLATPWIRPFLLTASSWFTERIALARLARLSRKRIQYALGFFRGKRLFEPEGKFFLIGESLPLVVFILVGDWVRINAMQNSE